MKNKIIKNKKNIAFYTAESYNPKLDIHTDTVIIKSDFKTAKDKILSWKKAGYSVQYVINLTCGDFSDYLNGKWDDINHMDEVQSDKNGKYFFRRTNTPYIIPTISFCKYISAKLIPIIETGVDAINIARPYFFIKSGYSESFRKEWEMYYKEPYTAPHSDIDSMYRACYLKEYIIDRAISVISEDLKSYANYYLNKDLKINIQLRGYLSNIFNKTITPINKIINNPYIDGIIVDSELLNQRIASMDYKENIQLFESVFFEFSAMNECVRFNSKDIWFSIDCFSQNFITTIDSLKKNYLAKISAAMFIPSVNKYIICDRPERVYRSDIKVPEEYFQTVQSCVSVLGKKRNDKEIWDGSDDNPIGIFISDTAMFQQEYPQDDFYGYINRNDINNFNNFYGLTHPFFSIGQKINMIPIENAASDTRYLNNYNVIILSYDFMKPRNQYIHYAINEWVRSGGVLIVAGTNNDSFNNLNMWWNKEPNRYKNPMLHLFELLGVSKFAEDITERLNRMGQFKFVSEKGITSVGNGIFAYFPESPAKCITEPKYSKYLVNLVFSAVRKKKINFILKSHYSLKLGPYRIITDISNGKTKYSRSGSFADITDNNISVKNNISLRKNPFLIVYDFNGKNDDDFDIVASTGSISDIISNQDEISFKLKFIYNMSAYVRIYTPSKCIITVNGESKEPEKEYTDQRTLLLYFSPSDEELYVRAHRSKI